MAKVIEAVVGVSATFLDWGWRVVCVLMHAARRVPEIFADPHIFLVAQISHWII